MTPLMYATKDNKTAIMDRMIELGADVGARNNVSLDRENAIKGKRANIVAHLSKNCAIRWWKVPNLLLDKTKDDLDPLYKNEFPEGFYPPAH